VLVRAYGDSTGDGMVQCSFTLPLAHSPRAEAAAQAFANRMGIDPAWVVHARPVGPEATFAVVYGRSGVILDLDDVSVPERTYPLLAAKELDLQLRSSLGRRAVVVGACVGDDAHTVGIDAICNVKGIAGEKGLESYREMRVVNLGAQVPAQRVVERALAENADAVLLSQVVTQRDAHLRAVRDVVGAFDAAGEQRPLLVVGGPRFDPAVAGELGVDQIFGRSTTPREVASYLATELGRRKTSGVHGGAETSDSVPDGEPQ
jgi:beta-lysine 5,6-aminomutase beta subunit